MSVTIALLSFVAVVSAILATRTYSILGFCVYTIAAGGSFATAVYMMAESLNR